MDVMPKHFTIQSYKATGNVFYTLRITALAVFPQKLASVAFLPDSPFLLLTHYPSSGLNGIPLSRRHTSLPPIKLIFSFDTSTSTSWRQLAYQQYFPIVWQTGELQSLPSSLPLLNDWVLRVIDIVKPRKESSVLSSDTLWLPLDSQITISHFFNLGFSRFVPVNYSMLRSSVLSWPIPLY